MKIGILTWHYYLNFGSALQAYALKETLETALPNKNKVEIINYRNPKHGIPSNFKNKLRLLVSYLFSNQGIFLNRRVTYPFLRFQNDYLKVENPFCSNELLIKKAKEFDIVVCGSDQIWAPTLFDPTYFLDFVPNNIKKISYAASIGLNDIPSELTQKYNELLNNFTAVSVRENKAKKLLFDKCNINAEVVLDPTLMLDINKWKKLERKPTDVDFDFTKPYIFCYFLNENNTYKNSVINYAQRNNLQIIGYSLNKNDSSYMYDLTGIIGPREFLWVLSNAYIVVTDSYHGTIFSLLNEKRFITFERFLENSPICQNSRILQLKEYFNIDNRIIKGDVESFEVCNVNYQEINKKLLILREKSLGFIKKALEK